MDRRTRFQRVRALCIGALVFGIGASVTLAAWTDPEYAVGSFTASTFGLEGSRDSGASYADYTVTGNTASFALPATAGQLSPNTTVYSGYQVRSTVNSVAGSVTLSGVTPAPAAGSLLATMRYAVRIIPADVACTQTSYAASTTNVVGTNASTGAVTLNTGGSTALPLAANGATPLNYCFAFVLPSGAPPTLQGSAGSGTWSFTATSAS